MSEVFVTNFTARLAVAIGSTDTTITLTSVPVGTPAGRLRFRLGNNQRTSEWLAADYVGSGVIFTAAQRGAEGGNPALAWPAGTSVAHVLTGESFNSLSATVAAGQTQANLTQYVRSRAERLFLYQNFA